MSSNYKLFNDKDPKMNDLVTIKALADPEYRGLMLDRMKPNTKVAVDMLSNVLLALFWLQDQTNPIIPKSSFETAHQVLLSEVQKNKSFKENLEAILMRADNSAASDDPTKLILAAACVNYFFPEEFPKKSSPKM